MSRAISAKRGSSAGHGSRKPKPAPTTTTLRPTSQKTSTTTARRSDDWDLNRRSSQETCAWLANSNVSGSAHARRRAALQPDHAEQVDDADPESVVQAVLRLSASATAVID